MAVTLVHMFIMHMYARGHMYTHTLINKCIKKLSSSHVGVLRSAIRRASRDFHTFRHELAVNPAMTAPKD